MLKPFDKFLGKSFILKFSKTKLPSKFWCHTFRSKHLKIGGKKCIILRTSRGGFLQFAAFVLGIGWKHRGSYNVLLIFSWITWKSKNVTVFTTKIEPFFIATKTIFAIGLSILSDMCMVNSHKIKQTRTQFWGKEKHYWASYIYFNLRVHLDFFNMSNL